MIGVPDDREELFPAGFVFGGCSLERICARYLTRISTVGAFTCMVILPPAFVFSAK